MDTFLLRWDCCCWWMLSDSLAVSLIIALRAAALFSLFACLSASSSISDSKSFKRFFVCLALVAAALTGTKLSSSFTSFDHFKMDGLVSSMRSTSSNNLDLLLKDDSASSLSDFMSCMFLLALRMLSRGSSSGRGRDSFPRAASTSSSNPMEANFALRCWVVAATSLAKLSANRRLRWPRLSYTTSSSSGNRLSVAKDDKWGARIGGSSSRSRSCPKDVLRGPERSRVPVKTDTSRYVHCWDTWFFGVFLMIITGNPSDLKMVPNGQKSCYRLLRYNHLFNHQHFAASNIKKSESKSSPIVPSSFFWNSAACGLKFKLKYVK